MSTEVESWTAWITDPFPEKIAGESALAIDSNDSNSCSTSSDLGKPDPVGKRIPARVGKIAKRKSRASKRIPTTYINTDPANFRAMVQQVTGIGYGLTVEPVVVKPDPLRRPFQHQQQSWMPVTDTLDFELGPLAGFDFPTLDSWGVM